MLRLLIVVHIVEHQIQNVKHFQKLVIMIQQIKFVYKELIQQYVRFILEKEIKQNVSQYYIKWILNIVNLIQLQIHVDNINVLIFKEQLMMHVLN